MDEPEEKKELPLSARIGCTSSSFHEDILEHPASSSSPDFALSTPSPPTLPPSPSPSSSLALAATYVAAMQVSNEARSSSSSSSSSLADSFSSNTTFDQHTNDSIGSIISTSSPSSSSSSSATDSSSCSSDEWRGLVCPRIDTKAWHEEINKYPSAGLDKDSEEDMIKERFAKLLLGEDLSGGGKGVSTALALSNAITNLSASVFGELWKLAPLSEGRKERWQKEMGRLLAVSDYIVEYVPSSQSCPDGTTLRVMVRKRRGDLDINLPALRKLDNMLIEALDSFGNTELWYADQDIAMCHKESWLLQSQMDKWWLPAPQVPSQGLSLEARKHLEQQCSSINQVLKAALAVNAQVLSEMEVPAVYWDTLPKNGKTSLGDMVYHAITSEKFFPDVLISSLHPMQEHEAVDLVNRVEMVIHIWQRKLQLRQTQVSCKDIQVPWVSGKDGLHCLERRQMLIERAESLLLLLRHRFPGLPQSTLDIYKIQYNKDVGQSILESYSRVLESLAYNIKSRMVDVIHADDVRKGDLPSESLGNESRGTVPSSIVQLTSGCLRGALVNPLHSLSLPSTPVLSPVHSMKLAIGDTKELGEHGLKVMIPWIGSYKHPSFSSATAKILQRSVSRH